MSILKYIGGVFAVILLIVAMLFAADRSGYKRGAADAAAACAEDTSLAIQEQLQKVADLNERNIAAMERSAAEAAAADQALDAQLTSTVKHLEKLRAQTISVGADCRRPYAVVRLYQQAASGPAALDRDAEPTPGVPGLSYDPLPPPGDAGD